MSSYDYNRQCWVEDGGELHRAQLRGERELVAGPEGEQYLRSLDDYRLVSEVLAIIDAQLAGI